MGVDPRGILRVADDPGPLPESPPLSEFDRRVKALLRKYGYDGQDGICALWFAQEISSLEAPYEELRASLEKFVKRP